MRHHRFVLAVPTIVAAVSASGGEALRVETRDVREVEWLRRHDSNSVARGLWEFRSTPSQDRVTLLVETSRGHRYVMTHVTDAPTGTMRATLVDDASGWNIRLVLHMGLPAPSTASWYRRFDPGALPADHRVEVEAVTSSGLRLGPIATTYEPDLGGHETLVADAGLRGVRAKLANEMPENLGADVATLRDAFTLENQYGFHMSSLIALLVAVSTPTAVPEDTAISVSRANPIDSRVVEFASQFKAPENPFRPVVRSH